MTTKLISPMKAQSKSIHLLRPLELLSFPLLASFKVDGFRSSVQEGVARTSSCAPVPNDYTRKLFSHEALEGLDGELAVGPLTAPDVFRKTSSGVTSVAGTPDVKFYVFDFFKPGALTCGFLERYSRAAHIVKSLGLASRVLLLRQVKVHNLQELLDLERQALGLGYEGLMLRSMSGGYKPGPSRVTMKEGYIFKLKRFADSEIRITGWEEAQHNLNEATIDAAGKKKRSTAKVGKSGAGMIGTLIGTDLTSGDTVRVGAGVMPHNERIAFFNDPASLLDRIARYKFFPSGSKEAPRHPTFTGFRSPLDLTAKK